MSARKPLKKRVRLQEGGEEEVVESNLKNNSSKSLVGSSKSSDSKSSLRKRGRPAKTNSNKSLVSSNSAEQGREGEEEVKSKRPCYEDHRYIVMTKPAPLTDELPAPAKRTEPITYEEAKKGTTEPVRVYADGVFDVFHPGHARALMQAKNAFPNTHLIAGVTNDAMTHKLKGQTVCSEGERYDALRHCRYVDEVLTDAPWSISLEFMDKYQIDFVAHDDTPYGSGDTEDIYKPVKDMGRFVAMQRTPGVSTSDIIARIVRDYDMYLRRNFSRGYTAKDMNVGFIKEKEVKLKEKMSHLKFALGENLVGGFMSLFGRDGRISEFFHGKKEMIKRVFSPGHSPEEEEMIVDGGGEASPTSTASFPSFPPSPGPLRNLDDIVTS